MRRLLALFAALWLAIPALAHEVRPGFLSLRESAPSTYELTFKRPMRGGNVLSIYPHFPEDCALASASFSIADAARVDSAVIRCEATLSGREVRIDGLAQNQIDVVVQVALLSGESQSELMRGGHDAFVVARTPAASEVMRSYIGLGVEHILLGVDHLLFVFGLLLLIRDRKSLAVAITAFTVAHSITLAVAGLGWVHVPQAPIEAVIAASIALLGVELLRGSSKPPGLTSQRPWLVAFSVGLLHGLGFAGALAEVGLPESAIPLALLSFNIGVEVGQLIFVAAVLVILAAGRRLVCRPVPWLRPATAYALGGLACFWVVERTWAFL